MKKFIIKLIKKIFYNYHRKFIYDLANKYINIYCGYADPHMKTNGELKMLEKIINENTKVVFDVGANIGVYTEEVLKLNNRIEVHCFEPDQEPFKILESKYRGVNNVHLNNIALSDVAGERQFYYIDKSSNEPAGRHQENPASEEFAARWSALSSFYKVKEEMVHNLVRVGTIDEYCRQNNINHLDLLKIDAEGHDFNILKGAISTLKNTDYIQFEYGSATIYARVFLIDILEFLADTGFELFEIKSTGLQKINYRAEMEGRAYSNYLAVNKNKQS